MFRFQHLDIICIVILVVFFGIFVPITGVLYYINAPDDVWVHVRQTVLLEYISNTLILSIGAVLGAVFFGTTAALLTHLTVFPGYKIIRIFLLIPLGLPTYLVTYSYAMLPLPTILESFYYSHGGAITLFSLCSFPYVYIAVGAVLKLLDQQLLDAATVLGRKPIRIALSLILPAILVGGIAVFIEVLTDFGTVDYLGIPTFATGIYRTWVSLGSLYTAVLLSLYLLLFVTVVLLILFWLKPHYSAQSNAASLKRRSLGHYQYLCTGYLVLLIILSSLLPVAILAYFAFSQLSFDVLPYILNTLKIAVLGMILVSVTGLYSLYTHPWARSLLYGVASVGHAVPAICLGIIAVAALDVWDKPDLFNSLGILLYIYVLHHAAPTWRVLNKSKQQLPSNIVEAAQTLGRSRRQSILKVELPLLNPAIAGGAALVFLELIKELPLILIFRPAGFETLSIRTYQLASDERLEQAAVSGLMMACLGITAALFYSRKNT